MDADWLIRHLALEPHPGEGGFFRETYRSSMRLAKDAPGNTYGAERSMSTAIYYLLTEKSFSAMHRLRTDEIFHFYLGDPVRLFLIPEGGAPRTIVMGQDLERGQTVQALVPAGAWQGLSLAPGGAFALLGTTVAPGFEYEDFELGRREELVARFPDQREVLGKLTLR